MAVDDEGSGVALGATTIFGIFVEETPLVAVVIALTSVGDEISIDVGRRLLSFHSCFHGASCSSVVVEDLRRWLRGDVLSSFNLIKQTNKKKWMNSASILYKGCESSIAGCQQNLNVLVGLVVETIFIRKNSTL